VLLDPEVVLLDPTLELLPHAVAITLRVTSSTEVWRRRDLMALIIFVPLCPISTAKPLASHQKVSG
jgi:hypothetical protein